MNIQRNQAGIAHIGMILVIVVVLIAVALVGLRVIQQSSNTDETNRTDDPSTSDAQSEATPKLQNVGLASMDSVLVTPDALREYDTMGLKGFYPFGDKLGGKTDTRLNPNFEFASLKDDTKVISAIDGVVAFIKEQSESGDTEVFIQPKEGSIWTIGYDHLTNVTVKKGDTVKAGAVIGQPAVQNNGALRFEIQINKDESGVTTHVCPSTLLDDNVKSQVLGQLTSMQQAWNTVTGLNLYDTAAQDPVGCLKKTMTVAEAEGR